MTALQSLTEWFQSHSDNGRSAAMQVGASLSWRIKMTLMVDAQHVNAAWEAATSIYEDGQRCVCIRRSALM